MGLNHRSLWDRTLTCLKYFLSLPLYWVSFVIPRSENIWVYGAWYGSRYADNSKHLFEFVCRHDSSIKSIWLSRDESIIKHVRNLGYFAIPINSLRGYWYASRAAVVFSSNGVMDLNRPAISRAKKVMLYHGIPLKKVSKYDFTTEAQRDRDARTFRNLVERACSFVRDALFPFTREDWDLILSTCPMVSWRMASAYEVDISQVKVTGFPRNDILLSSSATESDASRTIKTRHGAKKLILYAPTFRNRFEDNVSLFQGFDLQAFQRCLSVHEAAFLVKMHFVYKDAVMLMHGNGNGRLVHWLTEEEVPDMNTFLRDVDILITDYSSVYFDFLLLNRPIVFTPFDMDQYLTRDRQLYENYEEATPGIKCMNWNSVIHALDTILSGQDHYAAEREAASRRYHTYRDDLSCSRVYALAKSLSAEDRNHP